ncbi:MAG: DNA integrity scanning protein DisA nucleotide-binding domain protein [Candidatus Wallbacteria bacterium]|nr:DNA integrity scanning protein DisA nucleotide-binding domain protein [Candidatus Wallbacteria bacterium]
MNTRNLKPMAVEVKLEPRTVPEPAAKRRGRPSLAGYLAEERVIQLKSRSKERAFEELADCLAQAVPQFMPEQILQALLEREQVANTWVAPGPSADKGQVHLMVVILAPDTDDDGFLSVLAGVAELLKDDDIRQKLLDAETPAQILRIVAGRKAARRPGVRATSRTEAVLNHAHLLSRETGCAAIFLFGDPVENRLPPGWEGMNREVILVTASSVSPEMTSELKGVIQLPAADLTRFGQMNLVILLALSRGLVTSEDVVVYVTGNAKARTLDSICLLDLDREYNMFFRPETHAFLPPDLKAEVLERVLNIACDLSEEGREGKPVGALFVLGDAAEVAERSRQMVLNPFRGYLDEELNVLDPSLEETIKEYSTIDGSFIIRGDGVLLAAGAYLKPGRPVKDLPAGLGARHQAAASITASTTALAIAISESTGKVTLFKNGQILLDLDRYRHRDEGVQK